MLALILAAAIAGPAPTPALVAPDGDRVLLEVAVSDQERALGLMFRDVLPPGRGMLFLFASEERWSFWMKNTFITLDMVWLDGRGVVVDVRASVPPCRFDPCLSYLPAKAARAVVEFNAGYAAAHGIKPGVTLRFDGVQGYPAPGGKS
jgi:uncharacterized membrane protein (UPF0127 family)